MAIIGVSGKIGSGKDLIGMIIQYLTHENRHNCGDWNDFVKNYDSYYKDRSDWQIKKFAFAVKQVCSILTGIPVEDFEKEEVKNSYLGEEWNYIDYMADRPSIKTAINQIIKDTGEIPTKQFVDSCIRRYTVRQLLQFVGTDAIRSVIHQNTWVNALMNQYRWDGKSMTNGWVPSYQNPDNSGGHQPAEPIMPNWIITDVRFPNEYESIKQRGGIIIRIVRNKEIWKPIKNFENEAIVSNLGNVKSLSRNVFIKNNNTRPVIGKILKQNDNGVGYLIVTLSDRKTHLVHRLVAEAFIPNDLNKPQVNHKDGNKKNNKIDNLEWSTERENIKHGYQTGLQKAPNGEQHYNTKLSDVIKKEIWFKRNVENKSLSELSNLYNTNKSNICKIAKNSKFSNIINTKLSLSKEIVDIKEHPSETALDNHPFDYVIDNNGSIEELIEKVKEILIKEKIV